MTSGAGTSNSQSGQMILGRVRSDTQSGQNFEGLQGHFKVHFVCSGAFTVHHPCLGSPDSHTLRSILVCTPDLVKLSPVMAELSRTTAVLFKNLQDASEHSGLVQMVTSFNTVQKRGKGNINIKDVED
ncbi:hypothetical protein GGX14DRAFT_384773 [Mycena pura]|uniref:Uncharacterized protein n=1 Tax=Mycena pura TaxID=153505 RepID=A0AAD6YSB7_9AGAR|nr:hypothetical protein GGX14DRAFT_384773 [Mycena pura]